MESIFNVKIDIKALLQEIDKLPTFKDLEKAIALISSVTNIESKGTKVSDGEIVTKDILRKRD